MIMVIRGSKFIQILVFYLIGLHCMEMALTRAVPCMDSEQEALLKIEEGFIRVQTLSLHGRPKKIFANGEELDVTTQMVM